MDATEFMSWAGAIICVLALTLLLIGAGYYFMQEVRRDRERHDR